MNNYKGFNVGVANSCITELIFLITKKNFNY